MKKAQALEKWRAIPAGQNPLEHMRPIPYKSTGSRYGACGVRIDGSPAFVDAVLSNLKGLLDGENQVTRLELSRAAVDTVEINGETKSFANAAPGAEVCYIRLHVRGREGSLVAALVGEHKEATTRFAKTNVFAR